MTEDRIVVARFSVERWIVRIAAAEHYLRHCEHAADEATEQGWTSRGPIVDLRDHALEVVRDLRGDAHELVGIPIEWAINGTNPLDPKRVEQLIAFLEGRPS